MRVDAEKLNSYVNMAMYGVGKKGLNALNTAITLFNDNNYLSLITTSGETRLKVLTDISCDGFTSCSVDNTLFVNLISKLIGLVDINVVDGRELFIQGRGEYKLPIIHDYNGDRALINDVYEINGNLKEFSGSEMGRAISILSNSCGSNLTSAILCNLYFSNDFAMAHNDDKLIVIPNSTGFQGLLNLRNLSLVSNVFKGSTYYNIDSDNNLTLQNELAIMTTLCDSVEDYTENIDVVLGHFVLDNCVEIEYNDIIDVLNRGKLFVSQYDGNVINISINKNNLCVYTNTGDFIEEIEYISPNQVQEVPEIKVNILDLYSILKSCSNGSIMLSANIGRAMIIKQANYKSLVSTYEL